VIAISAYEMVDGVEPDQPYQDEVDGDDVVQQPGHDQDQNAGDKGDERRDVSDSENHCKSPSAVGMIRRALHVIVDAGSVAAPERCDEQEQYGFLE
jgi:hypothetical protein